MNIEQGGYKIRDYVVVKWAKDKEVVGIILGFPNPGYAQLELILTDKKSEILQRMPYEAPMEDIVGRPKLQYGILDGLDDE